MKIIYTVAIGAVVLCVNFATAQPATPTSKSQSANPASAVQQAEQPPQAPPAPPPRGVSGEEHLEEGVARLKAQQYEQSLKHFDAAVAQYPDYPPPLIFRGLTLFMLADFEGASRDIAKGLSLSPSAAQYVYNIYDSLRDYDLYRKRANQLTELAAQNPEAYRLRLLLAFVYRAAGYRTYSGQLLGELQAELRHGDMDDSPVAEAVSSLLSNPPDYKPWIKLRVPRARQDYRVYGPYPPEPPYPPPPPPKDGEILDRFFSFGLSAGSGSTFGSLGKQLKPRAALRFYLGFHLEPIEFDLAFENVDFRARKNILVDLDPYPEAEQGDLFSASLFGPDVAWHFLRLKYFEPVVRVGYRLINIDYVYVVASDHAFGHGPQLGLAGNFVIRTWPLDVLLGVELQYQHYFMEKELGGDLNGGNGNILAHFSLRF